MEALILSYALDTNGGNQRHAAAAAKHGRDADVLNALAIGRFDPAGVVARMVDASQKGGELRVRSVQATTYEVYDFPHDLIWWRFRGSPAACRQHGFDCYRNDAEVAELANAADVIHLNNSEMALKRLRIRKPALLHHHGSLFRGNPQRMLQTAKQYRMEQAVSTIDLQKPAPDLLTWLPIAYDIDALQAFGERHRRAPDGRIRIVHAPTNRGLKHTDLFLEAVRQLQEEGLPVDLDLIEGVSWAECMERKAKADIVFDQLAYGYGCNAIEAWGMGIPVIAGAEDPWVLDRMRELWRDLPFFVADQTTIKAAIRRLVTSPDTRVEFAEVGLAHVRKYHDEKPALAILADLYAKAIERYYVKRIPGKAPAKPVVFVKQGGRHKVYDDNGDQIRFVDGKVETTDPFLIDRLRYFARKKGAFGIEEVA